MSDGQFPPELISLLDAAQAAAKADPAVAKGAIADAEKALRRVARRATPNPPGYERIELKQDRGPTIEASARLLAETEFDTRGPDPVNVLLELWQTEGGALIAVTSRAMAGSDEAIEVTVIEPAEDVQAMHFAAMEFWSWDLRARSMVTKQLGWSLRRDVR